MNRRDFFKASAVGLAAATLSTGTEAELAELHHMKMSPEVFEWYRKLLHRQLKLVSPRFSEPMIDRSQHHILTSYYTDPWKQPTCDGKRRVCSVSFGMAELVHNSHSFVTFKVLVQSRADDAVREYYE